MDLLLLLALVVLVMWFLGFLVVPVGGSLIHFLLAIVLILVIVRLIRGQKVL